MSRFLAPLVLPGATGLQAQLSTALARDFGAGPPVTESEQGQVDAALERLQHFLLLPPDSSESLLPFVLGTKLSRSVLQTIVERAEVTRCLWDIPAGLVSLLIWRDPSVPHSTIWGTLSRLLCQRLTTTAGLYDIELDIVDLGDSQAELASFGNQQGGKQPDFALVAGEVYEANVDNSAGSIIFEAAVKNESLIQLLDELHRWLLNKRVQFTAGIKAFGVNDAPAHAPQLTWIALERITEDHLYLHRPIEFGGETACTAAGKPQFNVCIPSSAYFRGTRYAAAPIAQENLEIDLFPSVRRNVYRSLRLAGDATVPVTPGRLDSLQVVKKWATGMPDVSTWCSAATRSRRTQVLQLGLSCDM